MTIRFSSQILLHMVRSIPTPLAAVVGMLAVGLSVQAQHVSATALDEPGMVISQVWDDANRNGLQDSQESGIPGVTVSLLTCEGAFVMSSITGDFGAASFEAEAGCYRLYYEELQGHRYCPIGNGVNPQTDSDVDPSTRLSVPFEIVSGSYNIDIDAGIARALGAQIGDRVWHDQNANGIQDIGEPGMPGVSLDLLDCGGNIMRDDNGSRVSVASDEAGNFLFESVTSGCYRVGVTTATEDVVTAFQSGDAASDSDIEPDTMQSPPFELASDDTRYDLDVGLYRHGRVGDRVWLDVDRDGVQGSLDTGMADVLVVLLDANGVPTGITTTTGGNGFYRFGQLRPGDYRLQFVIPDGYAATIKNHDASDKLDSDANSLGISDTFSVTSDQKEPSLDFGLVTRQALTIAIDKTTNGDDADAPPGPYIEVGADVTWNYIVTNTGDQTVFDLVVTDDQGVEVMCPDDSLVPGEVVTCTGTGVAVAGQYANTATAIADDGSDDPVTVMVTDVSHYFGSAPNVQIRKSTNGVDADIPPGPAVPVGTQVNWVYTIENTGNVPLTDITVVDDQGLVVTCPFAALNPGVMMDCTASGTAVLGQYANVGTVTATPPVGAPVTDFDPSHYLGAAVGPTIEKYTNGSDADTAPGPVIPVGDAVTWTYEVINDTPFPITSLTVTDNQGVTVVCPQNFLAPGQTIECTGTGIVAAGQYANVGTACGIVDELEYCDADPSHYFGSELSLSLEKLTNGADADTPTGPLIPVGDPVTWTYTVTNNGNISVFDLTVTDDQGVVVTCPTTALAPGGTVDCVGTGIAAAGQYGNLGTACANDGSDDPTTTCDDDPSHYFGADLSINLEKSTNGVDADAPTGPSIAVGDAVNWTYTVTNTGNVALIDLVVTDNQGVVVTCPVTTLAPGASTDCVGTGIAALGQYANLGTACANDGAGVPSTVCDDDPSHYFGSNLDIQIIKYTNGVDANTAPGPSIPVGDAVTWTYEVTNIGNVSIFDLVVTDNQGVTVTCPVDALAPGATTTCTATGVATPGQYMNMGTACANDGADVPSTVCDDDLSHYFGSNPDIQIIKYTNGVDANTAPGPTIPAGDAVTWTYDVTNIGNVTIVDLVVTDNQGVTVTCPVVTLAPGATTTCTATGVATPGQYMNLGTACANDGAAVPSTVCDDDPSHYFGADLSINVEKSTNGVDADTPTGPSIPIGGPVTWTYTVTNTGNVTLIDLVVTDNQGVVVTCPVTTLAPGASTDCIGTGIAALGQYANLGTACANDGAGVPSTVCDDDPSHYFGSNLDIQIIKYTNGVDANTAPGPSIPVGAAVTWTYEVTNIGNVSIFDLVVTDNQGVTVMCPVDALAPGATTTCTATGVATLGQYMNLGTACANDGADVPSTVCDDDPSHYFGSNLDIQIIKYTNGADANTAPGPTIPAGDAVTWTYDVTNIGNVTIVDLVVTDNQGVTVTCPVDTLAPGATTTCTATGVATPGQYMNIGTACANDGAAVPATACDDDPSHYFGADLSIDVEKSTNGVDADSPTGPSIPIGEPVTWTYTVTNTGNVTLFDLVVTDNQGVVVTCPVTALAPGASTDCVGTGIATLGQYANLGTACANDGADVPSTVCDDDPSHYFGSNLDIQIIKYTNGEDANTPPGPSIGIGDVVTWTYEVTNIGNVTLFDLVVSDNQGVAVTCPVDALAPGATTVCTGTGVATLGQYANTGMACGNDGADVPTTVCDDDPSHYFGTLISIDLEKATNGADADNPSGPAIMVGDPVTWTYTVTNTGNVSLFDLVLTDDQGVAITCPADALAPGASFDCTASGIATVGQYANLGTACANDGAVIPTTVCDEDPSHYFGVLLAIDLEKSTNGEDADTPTGPMIATGDAVNWTYTVTNTGNITLFDVIVTDDQGVAVSCPSDALAPGTSMMCTGTGTAAQGQYANLGTVCGNDGADVPNTVCDDDPSHYFGLSCEVSVDATCLIPTPPSTDYECKKPIDSLTFIWDGAAPVRIKAWKGSVGSTLLADIDNIAPGDEVTVNGFAGSPNNVWWELFTAGTDTKIGESQFHLSCSDSQMNGPEDCGLAQGDGKDNNNHFINDWLLEGIVDDGGVLDCTPPVTTGSDSCTFNPVPVSCDTIDDLETLTFAYTGGTCADSQNGQGDKFDCTGGVNGMLPVMVEDADGNLITVNPGESFTLAKNDAKNIILSNAGGTMELEIHTSCSQPLNAGDVYGALTLRGLNGIGPGTDVIYGYKITNNGVRPLVNLSVVDIPLGPVPGVPAVLNPGEMVTLTNTAFVDMTTTNTVIVDAVDSAGAMCSAEDMVTVGLPPPPPCTVFNAPDHGFWMANFNGDGNVDRFDFDPGAQFTRLDDGTATLTGTVRDQSSSGRAFEVNVTLSGLTSTPPPGSPKNIYGYDTSDWMYYPIWSGTMTGIESYSGAELELSRRGPAFQIGTGANDQPDQGNVFGASGWLNWDTTMQADDCATNASSCIADTGNGDINIVLDCEGQGPPCSVTAEDSIEIDHDKIKWNIENTGAATATIESITITWPEDVHGDLKEIKLDGDKFFDTDTSGGTVTLGPGDWTGNADKREIDPGDIERLEFKFEGHNHGEYGPEAYSITVNFAEGCSVMTVTPPPPPPCDITGEGFLDIDKDKIKWNIENVGVATATIESITLTWPEDVHGDLKEIKLDGDRFFETNTSGGTVTLGPGDWSGGADKRQIRAGDIEGLEFKFEGDNNGEYGPEAYAITVNFAEGCSVTFVNTGAPFACVKPIREISMIWDGAADPIRVKAWKGNVGSDLLLDQSGISVGNKVTVAGLAGSPNDVVWEIFSGGARIGTSKFHLSCSDDDMDGEEDCGKREGNGKSDDNGLINDWLLDGMVDQIGSFDCTP